MLKTIFLRKIAWFLRHEFQNASVVVDLQAFGAKSSKIGHLILYDFEACPQVSIYKLG